MVYFIVVNYIPIKQIKSIIYLSINHLCHLSIRLRDLTLKNRIWKEKKGNFTVEKHNRNYLKQVFKDNITGGVI